MSPKLDCHLTTRSIAENKFDCALCVTDHDRGTEVVSHPAGQGVHMFCLEAFQGMIEFNLNSHLQAKCPNCRQFLALQNGIYSDQDERVRSLWKNKINEGASLSDAPSFLQNDYDFLRYAVSIYPGCYSRINDRLKIDKDFVLSLMEHDSRVEPFAADDFRYDEDFALAYVKRLRKYPSFSRVFDIKKCVLELVKLAPKEVLKAPRSIQSDADVATACIAKDFTLYFKLPWEAILNPAIFIFWLKQVLQKIFSKA
jgi:hypothetical protein